MNGDFQQFPKLNTRLMKDGIVKLLLEIKASPVEYPPELYEPRRDSFLAQAQTIKENRPGLETGDGGR